jgi:hypothetical protein
MATGVFEYFYPPWVISEFSLYSKEVVSDMLEFILLMILLLIFIRLTDKSNVFFNYIRIKIKVIGLDIEIKSKEKSTPSSQDKC